MNDIALTISQIILSSVGTIRRSNLNSHVDESICCCTSAANLIMIECCKSDDKIKPIFPLRLYYCMVEFLLYQEICLRDWLQRAAVNSWYK